MHAHYWEQRISLLQSTHITKPFNHRDICYHIGIKINQTHLPHQLFSHIHITLLTKRPNNKIVSSSIWTYIKFRHFL
ncbi:hypothetical protein OIU77_023460 [Salix suchowensis]|uniref:Uncharacterized protein n=1 Tax=Salix suchowensis TaxID=1278906 RepID=A0ABQ9C3W4_9ROSI|nr:hypothetical protein OIU77_023460 [Salix suchowensis]